ncbi:MAG: hypothetical protein ACYDBM_10755 [Candidatus Tyrphobacter sp.]
MRRVPRSVFAGIIAGVFTLVVSHGRSTPYDNYVLLAQAVLQGHVWIHWPGAFIDALPYNGLYYVIEAPFPAILLLPFVAIFGGANQTLLAVALAAVAVGAAWKLGERFGLRPATNAWICAFLLAGTDLLWCAMLGDVWFVAHVGAVCFTFLALVELAGKRRPWLVMLWAACAFESRFSLVLAVPVYVALMVAEARASERARVIASAAAVLVPVAILWIAYNELRWGTWSDIGYSAWYHQDQAGLPYGSPFRLQYLGYQLRSFFVQLPSWTPVFPWLVPGMSGVALTWTSPALLLAFFARKPTRLVAALWAAAILTALPNLLYYVNGFAQFGMRHALDFVPFLVALMMLTARERLPRWGVALIVWSVLVGLWGCWYWNAFVR